MKKSGSIMLVLIALLVLIPVSAFCYTQDNSQEIKFSEKEEVVNFEYAVLHNRINEKRFPLFIIGLKPDEFSLIYNQGKKPCGCQPSEGIPKSQNQRNNINSGYGKIGGTTRRSVGGH